MQPALLGPLRLLGLSLVASCLHAPISWSPDGTWLAYLLTGPTASAPGEVDWLTRELPATSAKARVNHSPDRWSAEGQRYRIWATHRESMTSVLIEESVHPLSSPSWGTDGRSLVFSRFIPEATPGTGGPVRGRYELVIKESADRQRVIPLVSKVEIAPELLALIAEYRACWSPDGRFVAIPRPGTVPGLLVVSPDQGRMVESIDRAIQPAWSPDGSRLALLRLGRDPSAGWSLQLMARDFRSGRFLLELAEPSVPPFWNPDGQYILTVTGRSRIQPHDLELKRVALDSGMSARAFQLGSVKPSESDRWFTMSLDRDHEQCIFSADDSEEVSTLAYCSMTRQQRLKRFHPLDFSMRLGSLALDPEGVYLAVRVETAGQMAPVLLCNPATEVVTLLAPDAGTRGEWLATLLAKSRELLASTVSGPSLDGRPISRQGLLPLAGEIPEQSPMLPRIRHLAKIGRVFVDQASTKLRASAHDDSTAESLSAFRLCFNYLRGDYQNALADLDELGSRTGLSDDRYLPLRAQILQAQGQTGRARDMASYLIRRRGSTYSVEETPAGPVVKPAEDSDALWYRYLAQQFAKAPAATPSVAGEGSPDPQESMRLIVPEFLQGINEREGDERPGFLTPGRFPRPNDPPVVRFDGLPSGNGNANRGGPPRPPRPFFPGRPVSPQRLRSGQPQVPPVR